MARHSRGGGRTQHLDSRIKKMHLIGAWSYGCTDGRMQLGEDVSLSGSLDPNRGEVYAPNLSSMGGGGGGVIEQIGVRLATKLGEKGIKSEKKYIITKAETQVNYSLGLQ